MTAIDPAGFEQKFQKNIDPWNYTSSPFEHFKRKVLLRACGCRTYGRGLELACAIGETTRYLSRRCLRLLAVDSSPTALVEAKRRLRGNSKVSFRLATLPEHMPHGPFDLIVASEIVYYLSPHALDKLVRRLDAATAPNGRVVILNHICPFEDAAQPPARAHNVTQLKLQKTMQTVFLERHRWFEVASFQKRSRR
jgi:SAM-dependent methyltransferase